MTPDLKLAIEKVNFLFQERDGAEWWSANIIEASAHLTDQKDWTKFYAYTAAPHKFNPNEELKPIGDDPMEIDFKYPDFMKEIRVQNGNETIIHIKNMKLYDESDECDEKVDS